MVKYNRIPHLNSYGADADVSGWVWPIFSKLMMMFLPFSLWPVGVQGNMVHFHDRRTYSNLSDLAELYVPTPASSPHSSGVIRLAHSPQSNLTPQGGLLAQGKEIAGYMPARRLKLRTAHSGQVRTPKRRSDLLPFLS